MAQASSPAAKSVFAGACPPGAADTLDATTGMWTNNCADYCKGDYNCIVECEQAPACHPEVPAPISGADVINSAIIAGGDVPPNAQCWMPWYISGPMNGADPGDKLFVGGGRRIGDGQLRNGEYLNLYTAQGVSTAFHLAGLPNTNTVISKSDTARPVQGVNVVSDSTGVASGAVYNYLGANNGVPYTPVNSSAAGASLPIPGQSYTNTGVSVSGIPATLAMSSGKTGGALADISSVLAGTAPTVTPGSLSRQRSVQVAGQTIYALTSQPRAAATTLASIMSSPASAGASSYQPSYSAFGRRFGTTYSSC